MGRSKDIRKKTHFTDSEENNFYTNFHISLDTQNTSEDMVLVIKMLTHK